MPKSQLRFLLSIVIKSKPNNHIDKEKTWVNVTEVKRRKLSGANLLNQFIMRRKINQHNPVLLFNQTTVYVANATSLDCFPLTSHSLTGYSQRDSDGKF